MGSAAVGAISGPLRMGLTRCSSAFASAARHCNLTLLGGLLPAGPSAQLLQVSSRGAAGAPPTRCAAVGVGPTAGEMPGLWGVL
eukprot:7583083-Alexandrium_andersonii.AAC.1